MTTAQNVLSVPIFFLIGCAGKSENQVIDICPSGGASATSGGSSNTGGTLSTGTTTIGCPGQAVTYPALVGTRHCVNEGPAETILIGGFQLGYLGGSGGCTWPALSSIPLYVTDTGSDYTDPNNMSLVFEALNGAAEVFPNVVTASDCTGTTGGWYYDNNSSPSTMTLCPCSCERLTGSQQAMVYMVDFPAICVIL